MQGGKDAADPRYLHTKLSPETRILFPEEDDAYAFTDSLNDEEWKNTEPKRYYPIVPMVLVNGCNGVASGWSTFIPNYKLEDVISNLERLISTGKIDPMDPWYKGFKGTITKQGKNRYKTSGQLDIINETRLVTELPIQVWTNNYEDFLNRGKEKRGKVPAFIEDYKNLSDATTVSIQIKLKKTKEKMTIEEETEKLRLTKTLSTSNMYLLDENGKIKKYESPQEIIEDFYRLRLPVYKRRKEFMLEELSKELQKLECKVALLTDVTNGEFKLDITMSYAQLYEKVKEKYEEIGRNLKDYSFLLLDLSLSSWSQEALLHLQKAREEVEHKIEEVETSDPTGVWISELQKLREETEISSSASQPLEGQKIREPEGSSICSKAKRTRSPGSTSGEKERKK